jgi:DNA-binding FadR family transcriptional regulator
MRGLFNLLRVTILNNLEKIHREPEGEEIVRKQHGKLFNAIMAGDGEAAREAAHTHLRFVAATLREAIKQTAREKRSRRRLQNLEE